MADRYPERGGCGDPQSKKEMHWENTEAYITLASKNTTNTKLSRSSDGRCPILAAFFS
jgi:hypothetical protein